MRAPFAQKKCERCGGEFACGSTRAEGRCWCMELPVLNSLPLDVRDCLCENCLRGELGL
ncbi:MAG: cysteine-rich CWC family protein [Bdellovibrionota bacterium]